MIKNNSGQKLIYWLMMGLGLLIFSSALIFLIFLGSHMRLSGDDYCYNAVLAQQGFFKMQSHSYLNVSMYNGNRFSLTLLSGFFGLFPIHGAFLLITASLITWLGGMMVLLRWASRKFGFYISWLERLLIAEGFASFVLWSAPSLEQSLFWRSGMLPYLLPMVAGTWVLALVCYVGQETNRRWLLSLIVLLGAVFVGGFSETGAVFWGGFWGLCLLILLSRKWLGDGGASAKFGLPVTAAILGTGIAILLMAISPSTALRLASRPEPLDLANLLPLLVLNTRVYLWINVIRRTWMVLIPIIFGLGIGLGIIQTRRPIQINSIRSYSGWKIFGMLCVVGASALFLIACVMLPVTFIQSDYPPDRALILSQAVLVGAGIAGGILVIFLMDRWIKLADLQPGFWRKLIWAICVLMLALTFAAPLQLLSEGSEELPLFSRWSRLWDLRHDRLVDAGQNNVETIHVVALDHVIEDVGELSSDHDYWYNNCAEMYYGIDAIVADEPGW